MKQLVVRRPNSGWLEITLDDTEMDFLRARIDKKGISTKRKLAGNISASYRIEDKIIGSLIMLLQDYLISLQVNLEILAIV